VPTSYFTNTAKTTFYQYPDVKSALTKLKNKNENILITGSIAIAGEALEYLKNITPELYPYL
jgi:folylpolyglutamate synthase/dihydropteroate synthase